MSRSLADALRDLPPSALVPAGWVLEQLGIAAADPLADLTLEQVAAEHGRAISTVRAWCPDIPGAYRLNGREWRVPRAGLRAYLNGQRDRKPAPAASSPADLSSWRQKLKMTGS